MRQGSVAGVLLGLGTLVAACNGVLGLDAYTKVGERGYDAAGEGLPDADPPGAGPPDVLADGGAAAFRRWPRWPLAPSPPEAGAFEVVADAGVRDPSTGLLWAAATEPAATLAEAAAVCARRPGGVWVVPTRIELLSLVDPSREAPAQPPELFADAPEAVLWSASPPLGVDFFDGAVVRVRPGSPVRCVRLPDGRHPQRPYDTFGRDAALIRDGATNLVWLRALAASSATHAEAQALCAAAAQDGGGFRLPRYRELASLVDDVPHAVFLPGEGRVVQRAIDPDAFPDTPDVAFWASDGPAASPAVRWTVDFRDGSSARSGVGARHAVRCVRGGAP